MKTAKIFFYSIFLIAILTSCSGSNISDIPKVLRNEKIKSSDEFFVKKREPLTEPPDSAKLPIPSTEKENEEKQDSIESILKVKDAKNNTNRKKSSSVEDFIINQIKK